MGGPKYRTPRPPPPPPDYADQALRAAGEVKGPGSRRKSFITAGPGGAGATAGTAQLSIPTSTRRLLGS